MPIFTIRISINVAYIPLVYTLSCFSPQTEKLRAMNVRSPQLLQALSKNIKKYRAELKLSQEKLALAAGVDRSYMSEIERGLANPTLDLLLKISNVLKIQPSKLLEL